MTNHLTSFFGHFLFVTNHLTSFVGHFLCGVGSRGVRLTFYVLMLWDSGVGGCYV